MTNQEILEKAIQKAIDGGWKPDFTWPLTFSMTVEEDGICKWVKDSEDEHQEVWQPVEAIIFNHDFAKALWGEDWANFYAGQSGDTISMAVPNWKGHLANMVVAPGNPVKYLGKNI